jgi:hypothetical protein
VRREVKLAKDIDVGDNLLDLRRDPGPLRVYRVQRLPDGHLMVSWWAGNEVTGFGVFRPDEPVIEYADEVDLR